MASIAKGNNILWNIRSYRPGMSYAAMWWEDICAQGWTSRALHVARPPLAMEFKASVAKGEIGFSYNADLKVVMKLYRSAFAQAFGDVQALVPCCEGSSPKIMVGTTTTCPSSSRHSTACACTGARKACQSTSAGMRFPRARNSSSGINQGASYLDI